MRAAKPDKSIFKRRRGSGFTTLPKALFQNPDISFEAMGFLGCIMSLPEDWSFNRAWAQNQYGVGKDKLERIIRELMKADYVRREQERDDAGRMGVAVYVFSDEPGEFEDCTIPPLRTVGGFAADGSPAGGKSATTKDLSKYQRNIELTKGAAVANAARGTTRTVGSPKPARQGRGALAARGPKEGASNEAGSDAAAMQDRIRSGLKATARKLKFPNAPEAGTGRAAEQAARRSAR